MKHLRLAGLVAWAALLVGCQATVIDGWPIGAEADCTGRVPTCDELIAAAEAALIGRDGPIRSKIVSARLYYEVGGPTRTTGNTVAVFALADGGRRAIFVGYSPGGPITVNYGP